MGKKAVSSISEKQELCAYSDQFPLASQQNFTNYFSLWDNISFNAVLDSWNTDGKMWMFTEVLPINFWNNTLTRM